MATKNFATLAPSQMVGPLTFSQASKISGASFHLVHPDNFVGQQLSAFEAVGMVCSVLNVRAPVSKLNFVADAFITKTFASDKGDELVADLVEALKGGIAELSPEEDFEEDSAIVVKRALQKMGGQIDRIVSAGGALVLIQTLYGIISEQAIEDSANLAWCLTDVPSVPVPLEALEGVMDEDTGVLAFILEKVKVCNVQMKKWERENVKFVKTAEYVTND